MFCIACVCVYVVCDYVYKRYDIIKGVLYMVVHIPKLCGLVYKCLVCLCVCVYVYLVHITMLLNMLRLCTVVEVCQCSIVCIMYI